MTKELSLCHKLKFLIPISLQPDSVNNWYSYLRLFDLTEFIVWNIYGIGISIKNQSLWQKLNLKIFFLPFNSFLIIICHSKTYRNPNLLNIHLLHLKISIIREKSEPALILVSDLSSLLLRSRSHNPPRTLRKHNCSWWDYNPAVGNRRGGAG